MFSKFKKSLKKIGKKTLSEKNMQNVLDDLKELLLKHNVAVDAAYAICEITQNKMTGEQVGMFSAKKSLIEALKSAIGEILSIEDQFDILEKIREKRTIKEPYIILVLGVNGTGKTTTIAKLAHLFKREKIATVVAASDTFRAGAIEQLAKHLERVGVKIIKGQYKADPASIAYDTIEHAKAKSFGAVIIDTAGRQVTNKNLMEEIKKIKRINNPDITIFIGDSLAGNDVLTQAKAFNEALGIDASIITKLDADPNGGAALSIAHITQKPILYVGIGQGYDDLLPFDPEWFINKLLG